ncbi:MAG: HAD family hydrolase [Gammaproteobacteria bacterium]
MALAIFDLDNTLIGGDSDYLWGKFLVEQGIVDKRYYESENQRFYDEYVNGTLDIYEFLSFQLQPLANNEIDQLRYWRQQFLNEKILPIMLSRASQLLQSHRDKGEELLIITATNRFITEPIAAMLGVENLLATEPEFIDNRYTGNVAGIPCFRDGKVKRLDAWLTENGRNLESSSFYSDSHNDLPLLELVTRPVAVDPDNTLRQHAQMKGWLIISLR